MTDIHTDMACVQRLTFDAYKTSGQILALLDSKTIEETQLGRILDIMSEQFEKSTIELRNICEKHRPASPEAAYSRPMKQAKHSLLHAGILSINERGWITFKLDALLPNCRYGVSPYLSDTIGRLMDEYEQDGNRLPWFEKAAIIIREHCDIKSRQVYDQDNKGWKAIPNALKGRVINDDDQFSLHVCLLSEYAPEPCCYIHLINQKDIGDFFAGRSEKHPSVI